MGNKITSEHIVVITGGGGYLGSMLAERLAKKNCTIYLLDVRFNTLSTALSVDHENIHCEILDLTDKQGVHLFCKQIFPNFIFHFASLINRDRNFSIYDRLYEVNVKGTLNLLEGLKEVPYSGFYFSSTSEVYGPWKHVPFSEADRLHPMSPYSLTKVYGEKMIELFSELNDKPYKILRLFNFYGPNIPSATFIGQMIEAYKNNLLFEMTKGKQARDFLFIDDLISQVLLVSESGSEHYIFNLCSGKSIKMVEVAETFKKLTDGAFEYSTSIPYRKNEVWDTRGDNSKIKALEYDQSYVGLVQGLRKCIEI